MKKVFVLCLFVILSLGLFAQKIKSDGKPHFDKILWELWIKEVDADKGMVVVSIEMLGRLTPVAISVDQIELAN